MTNQQEIKHTPTPWIVSKSNAGAIPEWSRPVEILARGGASCVASRMGDGPEAKANAEFIDRAINSHEQMLNALKHISKYLELNKENGTIAFVVNEAIQQAEGK